MRVLVLGLGMSFLCSPLLCAEEIRTAEADIPARQILPVTLVPEHYELSITPDAQALNFAGELEVTGDAPAAGTQIALNAKGLILDQIHLDGVAGVNVALDDALGRATLTFAAPYAPGRHALHITYHGPISRGTLGLFAMDYDSPAGKQRTLGTNFEPAEARRLLPCWDEPGLKATFSLSVDAPADRMAISNMPVYSRKSLPDGRVRVRFAETPRMSTYLLFLAVGDFEREHRNVDGVEVGVVVKRGDRTKGAYALDQATSLLRYYNNYFGVRYPLPKLDLIAAPGAIEGGAMENWGAIFYSQDALLFDPVASTEPERQGVFLTVAHEMAHQWFGDLVTMAWWDNLWLNEGFARWMQTEAADALHPEWKTGLAAANIFESGRRDDAQSSTHPILQPVASVEQAMLSFDAITYNKGAAVITMLEAYVGAEAFREGVRSYMKAHAYGNSVDADLWTQIQSASGKPVLDIEHDFTQQPGVPLIRVEQTKDGTRLVEGRFMEDPDNASGIPALSWRIPLTVAAADGHRSEFVFYDRQELTDSFPLVNAGAMAYARVAYPEPIARALAGRIDRLPARDQINLLNDAWALGKSGYAPARNLMAFVARLPADADPIVWQRTLELLTSIDRAYRTRPGREEYRREVLRLLTPLAHNLATPVGGESANRTKLKSALWNAQARFGDVEAIARARRIHGSGKGTVDDRRTALDIVAAEADSPTFESLLARARRANDPLERSRLLNAMAGARDPALSARMVDLALGPVAPAGTAADLLSLAGTENPDAVWEALRPRLAKGPLPIDYADRWYVIPAIAARSAEPARIEDVRRYGEQDMPADARRPIEAAVDSIKLNQRIRAVALPDLNAWVEQLTRQ
jgi:aminopeptidase N